MSTIETHLHEARSQIDRARRQASPFIEKFARAGYVAKGVVYVVVGGLAAYAAIGSGQDATGSEGAMQAIARQPFGQVLLGVLALGLLGYALWQFILAVEDPEREGSDARGIARRIGFAITAIIHLGLVVYAAKILIGGRGGGGGEGAKSWSAWAMGFPLGQWIVGIIGISIIAYAVGQMIKAFKSDLGDQLHLGELSPGTRRTVVNVSRGGMAARAITFAIIGAFLTLAAYQHDANEAIGLDGALQKVREQPYGPWLLGLVALGFIAYGIYQFVLSRYRHINPT